MENEKNKILDIYKNIKIISNKKSLTLKQANMVIFQLLQKYTNYFKEYVKEIDFTGSKISDYPLTFKINNYPSFLSNEGLFINNILINELPDEKKEEEKPKININSKKLRKIKINQVTPNIYKFKYKNIDVEWTDYYAPLNEKLIKSYIDAIFKQYPFLENKIYKINFVELNPDKGIYKLLINDKKAQVIPSKEKDFILNIEEKTVEDPNINVEPKINQAKVTLKRNKKVIKKADWIDSTIEFQNSKTYLWSIFCKLFEDDIYKIKIFNLNENNFYLFIYDWSKFENKNKNLKEAFKNLNYKISFIQNDLNLQDIVIFKFKKGE